MKICKKGGWIAWHDYRITAWWSGVTKYIHQLAIEYPNIMHIHGTTTVILKKNWD